MGRSGPDREAIPLDCGSGRLRQSYHVIEHKLSFEFFGPVRQLEKWRVDQNGFTLIAKASDKRLRGRLRFSAAKASE